MAGRGVGGGAAAGPGGPERRLPQLLRLAHGQAQGPQVGPPRFRSRKDNRQAIRFTANARCSRSLANGRLRLPKIGDLAVRWSRHAALRPVHRDGHQGRGRPVLRLVRRGDRRQASRFPRSTPEVGIDLGLTHFAVLSDGTKVDSPTFLRRAPENAEAGCSRTCPASRRAASNRKQGPAEGRPRARAGGRRAPRFAPQAVHDDHPREPSGVRRGPVRGRSRPDPAGQVRARRRLVGVRGHAGVQGRPVRAHLRPDRPVRRRPPRCARDCGRSRTAPNRSTSGRGPAACGAVHDRDVNAAINIPGPPGRRTSTAVERR